MAIVGRPNVGKSTLFNRLTHSRRSIVGDEPGITRDRIYGDVEWDGRIIRLVDTGGIVTDDKEYIPSEIYRQAQRRPRRSRPAPHGRRRPHRTRLVPTSRSPKCSSVAAKPVFLVANKVENPTVAAAAENFRQLGLQNVFMVSSEHGLGIGDLLDAIFDRLPAPAASGIVDKEAGPYAEPARPRIEPDLEDDVVFDEDQEDEIEEDMGPEIDDARRPRRLDSLETSEFGPEERPAHRRGCRS